MLKKKVSWNTKTNEGPGIFLSLLQMSLNAVYSNRPWSPTSDKTGQKRSLPASDCIKTVLVRQERCSVPPPFPTPALLGLGQMVQSLEQMLTTRTPSLSFGQLQCAAARCHAEALAQSGTHLTTVPLPTPAVLPTMLLGWRCSLAIGLPGVMECCAVQGKVSVMQPAS